MILGLGNRFPTELLSTKKLIGKKLYFISDRNRFEQKPPPSLLFAAKNILLQFGELSSYKLNIAPLVT